MILVVLDNLRIPAEPGQRLLDILDEFETRPLPTSCRAAHCATCRVRVLKGEEALAPAGDAERETLEELQAAPNERLGCQLTLRKAPGSVEVILESA